MLSIPRIYTLLAGSGEGKCKLTAFDAALLDAGAGNLNLIKVSSILPQGACFKQRLEIPPGSLVPTAYGSISSSRAGEEIAVAVAVGVPVGDTYGVIMEHAASGSKEQIEAQIHLMVEEAFSKRQLLLKEIRSCAVAHRVVQCGSVFAGVILWY